jgi:hypothetical protein
LCLPLRRLLVHEAPICPEACGKALERRRAFARGGAQLRHHARVFVQDQPHRDRVHRVDAAAVAIVELCDESLDTLQVDSLRVFRGISCRRLAVRPCVAQDPSQLREPPGGVHRA